MIENNIKKTSTNIKNTYPYHIINGPQGEKTCLWGLAKKDPDQPVHPQSLISTFIIHFLENVISQLATNKTF